MEKWLEKWLVKLQIMFLGRPWKAQKSIPVKPALSPAPRAAQPAKRPVQAPAPKPTRPSTVRTYRTTGISYRMDALMSLASENPDYNSTKRELIEEGLIGERVWKYDFYVNRAEVVPEPDNPHDPKAIKVMLDGVHVGYIKAGSCAHLLNVIRQGRLWKIAFDVAGGPYKWIGEDETDEGKTVYEMEKDTVPYYVHLHITELE